ncbi:DUF2812 domain-containing protein [Pseudobacillus badius]|uniref:DUF2812 domain-containing protein n=1 Tax=Bacillus badius TaxID=1455 RepID=UPI001CBCC4C8|nr:DUF2812 domain-containing protein [Bacillus badius]UAT30423.1 DUF2812 domain-containing protein [Bacillus badius]GLY09155.1 hypothetical protein Bbad01_03710 [Bacillus badius]
MGKQKNRRYMSSGGLAFSEEKDMKKLSKMAEKGWILHSFAPMGYTLHKSNPRHLIYSLDYQYVPKEELEDYYDVFRAGGWQPVCSEGNMHIFSAAPGTRPIYTDRSTVVEKYKQAKGGIGKAVVFLFAVTIILYAATTVFFPDSTADHEVVFWIRMLPVIFLFPALLTWLAYQVRIGRQKG